MLKWLTSLNAKSALGRLVRLPLSFIPLSQVITVRSGLNKGARWIVGSSTHGCWLGTYEAEKQDLISKLIRKGMVVWDIGANAGFYTIGFSRLVGSSGRVYAFEPLAENANNLIRHVRLNELSNTTFVQAALASRTGLSPFAISESNSMGCLSEQSTSYLVPTMTADGWLRDFPDCRPDLIKIDVEGAEAQVLLGAAELLRTNAPILLLALHGEAPTRQCREILLSHGYSLYYMDGSPADSGPLKHDEIFARKL